MNNVAQYFLYFIMYSVFGWIMEMIYCTITNYFRTKKFSIHNRGFLYGPLCPIYGTAATVMILGLSNIKNVPLMVVTGVILCDTIEYFTSYIMEKLFHTRWWDYSDKALNIHGRIDLNHSIQWGVLSYVFINYIHPFFSNVFESFNETQLIEIAVVVFAYFLYDIINTVASTISIRNLQSHMENIRASFSILSEDSPLKREKIPEYVSEFRDKLAYVRRTRRARHILIAFPEIMNLMEKEMDEIQSIPHEFMNDIDDIRREIRNFIDDHRPEMH